MVICVFGSQPFHKGGRALMLGQTAMPGFDDCCMSHSVQHQCVVTANISYVLLFASAKTHAPHVLIVLCSVERMHVNTVCNTGYTAYKLAAILSKPPQPVYIHQHAVHTCQLTSAGAIASKQQHMTLTLSLTTPHTSQLLTHVSLQHFFQCLHTPCQSLMLRFDLAYPF